MYHILDRVIRVSLSFLDGYIPISDIELLAHPHLPLYEGAFTNPGNNGYINTPGFSLYLPFTDAYSDAPFSLTAKLVDQPRCHHHISSHPIIISLEYNTLILIAIIGHTLSFNTLHLDRQHLYRLYRSYFVFILGLSSLSYLLLLLL